MLIIGLTGGIGSGKSLVAALFSNIGVPVIDTDVIARQLVEPGKPLLEKIIAAFGQQYLTTDGELDRTAMRDLVFSDIDKRRQLEAILHPAIWQQCEHEIAGLTTPYVVLVVPLLIENQSQARVDRVLVVDCPVSTQRQRVEQRDHLSDEQIDRILAAQCTREQRLSVADDILYNNTDDPDNLKPQVQALHEKYLRLADQSSC